MAPSRKRLRLPAKPSQQQTLQRAFARPRHAKELDLEKVDVSAVEKVNVSAAQKPAAPAPAPESKPLSSVDGNKPSENEEYVPVHLYNHLEYSRRGEKNLPENEARAFSLVEDHYNIPKNIEKDARFGPLSGLSFEERALAAYAQGALDPKDGANAVKICLECGTLGHLRRRCPTLI
mmetsp:Transcript_33265/g.105190  ORF Transcript_33265/g.105190 Transcript_33265/m.105190 type:complete len:177 (-) Transcript_33265:890-1420(-)